jgi:hypothetical protein
MVSKSDFGTKEVEAAKSVMIELIHLLGEFKDSMVLVGGSVPPLLYPESASEYVGTLDVDLALNHQVIDDSSYNTIRKLLLKREYYENEDQPFMFYRDVPVSDDETIIVKVDFLSGEYGGTAKSHRTQQIQDIRARKARGSDLVFEQFKEVEIEGELPGGGKDKVSFKISAIVPFIVMKGMAVAGRIKEKDSWDIYYCLTHHPGEIDSLVEEFKPFIKNKLVLEGLNKIAEKFESTDHIGPKHVVTFMEISEKDEQMRIRRDVYERVNFLLKNLGII